MSKVFGSLYFFLQGVSVIYVCVYVCLVNQYIYSIVEEELSPEHVFKKHLYSLENINPCVSYQKTKNVVTMLTAKQCHAS